VHGKRGVHKNMQYLGRQVMLTYEMPLNEVVMDFFDKLKSASRVTRPWTTSSGISRCGHGQTGYLDQRRQGDALSLMVHRANALTGRDLAARMRELIPRQMFDVAVQAAWWHIIAAKISSAAEKRSRQIYVRHQPQEENCLKSKRPARSA